MIHPRRFQLHRDRDVTGVSGTGIVADGVVWPDGAVSIRWRGDRPSTVAWATVDHAIDVHGHNGSTKFVWLDADDTAEDEQKHTQRGFRIYAELTDRYGSTVRVQESSLATEDCVWIQSSRGDGQRPPHLTVDQARTILDALSEWLRDVEAGVETR